MPPTLAATSCKSTAPATVNTARRQQDATMIEAFRQGIDIHSSTGSKVFDVPLSAVDLSR